MSPDLESRPGLALPILPPREPFGDDCLTDEEPSDDCHGSRHDHSSDEDAGEDSIGEDSLDDDGPDDDEAPRWQQQSFACTCRRYPEGPVVTMRLNPENWGA